METAIWAVNPSEGHLVLFFTQPSSAPPGHCGRACRLTAPTAPAPAAEEIEGDKRDPRVGIRIYLD